MSNARRGSRRATSSTTIGVNAPSMVIEHLRMCRYYAGLVTERLHHAERLLLPSQIGSVPLISELKPDQTPLLAAARRRSKRK